jgi:hypothetical protein
MLSPTEITDETVNGSIRLLGILGPRRALSVPISKSMVVGIGPTSGDMMPLAMRGGTRCLRAIALRGR